MLVRAISTAFWAAVAGLEIVKERDAIQKKCLKILCHMTVPLMCRRNRLPEWTHLSQEAMWLGL